MKLVRYFLIFLILLGCKQTEDKKFLVTRIRSAAKLSTMEVVLTKIVVGQNIEQKKFAGIIKRNSEAAIFNTEATIKYGIRLDKITNKDVFVKGDSISLILPPVEILNFSYPHEKFVELYPLSNFNRLKKNKATFEDLDKVFRLAEADIRKKVNLLKLKEEAEIKTIKFLELFLTKIGYYNINIEFKEEKKGANS